MKRKNISADTALLEVARRKTLSPMLRGNAWRGCKLLYSSHRHVRF